MADTPLNENALNFFKQFEDSTKILKNDIHKPNFKPFVFDLKETLNKLSI